MELVDGCLDERRISTMSRLCLLHPRRSALQHIRLRRPQGGPTATFDFIGLCLSKEVMTTGWA